MKHVVELLFFLSSVIYAKEVTKKNPQAELQTFLKVTELKPGLYKLVKGSESCQAGTLRLVPLENEFTLMLGAHPLVMGLGTTEFGGKDRECVNKGRSSYSSSQVMSSREETCFNITRTYDVLITVAGPGKFSYVKTIKQAGKPDRKDECDLEWIEKEN